MVTHGRCWARAALAGNPSDGYGGFVVSVPVRSVAATVRVEPAERFEVVHSPTADDTFADLAALVDHLDSVGYDDARRLVLATVRELVRRCGVALRPLRIDVETTIPRSVGLAGSSAIVVATVRALLEATDRGWGSIPATHGLDDPARLAALALGVERDELGIAAGLQDRLVQSHGAPVAMDFADGDGTTAATTVLADLDRTLLERPLLVAVRQAAAEPSGVVHSGLRERWEADARGTRATMARIADEGRGAAAAVRAGDLDELGRAMDRTLELRAGLVHLDAALSAAAAAVRAAGGHANWSGSGGAITVLPPPEEAAAAALVAELETAHGCSILRA
ncbi:mevalonate kinase [Ilumatobacter sp.]|uniref:mevalonate kinase family protein n=1 Tax=Ilumatobacter sp. TaxID=1967498 RepID=UPI003B52EFCB